MGEAKRRRASGYAPDRKRPLDLFEWARLPLPDAPRKLAHAPFASGPGHDTGGPKQSADVDRLTVQSVRLSVFSAQTSMPDASID